MFRLEGSTPYLQVAVDYNLHVGCDWLKLIVIK
jgi:hypothetical protein